MALHEHILELWGVTCHIGSDSVACHPTQVNMLCLTTSEGMEGRVVLNGWVRSEVVFTRQQTVTHPSNNLVTQCRASSLLKTDALTSSPCRCLQQQHL